MQSPASTSAQHHTGLQAEYDVLLSNLHNAQTSGIHTDNTYLAPQPFSPLAREFDQGSEHIAELAHDLGAEVPAGRHLSLTHVLKYYGFAVPRDQSTTALAQLIRQVEEKIANHQLGLEQGPDLGSLLSDDDREKIDNEISLVLGDEGTPIIDRLAREASTNITVEEMRRTPDICLLRLLDSHKARYLSQRLIDVLGWYGAGPGEETAPGIGIGLLAEALRVWYSPSPEERPDTIAGYRLQQHSNFGKSYRRIRSEFEDYLLDSGRVSTPLEKIVLARLLLRQFPVEFQVRNIPQDLPYATSIVWVNFVHGARLAHALDPQLLQRLTFQQLVDLPLRKSENASQALLDLIAVTRVAAAGEWARATGADDPSDENATQALSRPIAALEKYTKQLNVAIVQMTVEPQQRLKLAREQLVKAFANFGRNLIIEPLETRLMRDDGYAGNRDKRYIMDMPSVPGTTYPLLEVYASGGLTPNTKWYVSKDGKTRDLWISLSSAGILESGFSLKDSKSRARIPFPANLSLPNISALFDSQFNSYLDKTKNAYETLIKSQLVTLPWADRQALEHGEVRVYTLREETRQPAEDETNEMTLPLRARMGFVLRADYSGKTSFYECLPRDGLIRVRTDISISMVGGVRTNRPIQVWYDDDYVPLPIIGGRRLPFDWDAHKQGAKPKRGSHLLRHSRSIGSYAQPPSTDPFDISRHHPEPDTVFTPRPGNRLIHF